MPEARRQRQRLAAARQRLVREAALPQREAREAAAAHPRVVPGVEEGQAVVAVLVVGRDAAPGVRLRLGVVAEEEAVAPEQVVRSEEHTSELQSRQYLVCRLL